MIDNKYENNARRGLRRPQYNCFMLNNHTKICFGNREDRRGDSSGEGLCKGKVTPSSWERLSWEGVKIKNKNDEFSS